MRIAVHDFDGRTMFHLAAPLFVFETVSQHPTVDVRQSGLLIDHDDVLTSAGTASALDACLHIVRTSLGSAAASTSPYPA